MGVDDLGDGQRILLHQFEDRTRIIARVNDDTFACLLTPQDIAIFLKEANGEALNDHARDFLGGFTKSLHSANLTLAELFFGLRPNNMALDRRRAKRCSTW